MNWRTHIPRRFNQRDINIDLVCTVLEPRIVLQSRYGTKAVQEFDEMLGNSGVIVVPFDGASAEVAFYAFLRFGKGQGHPEPMTTLPGSAPSR
jgi:uncharacterized protein with PIN domain